MALPFQNQYNLRRVAESAAKPCFICYRPTAAVLITPDKADFFYVCQGHLTDKGFASPVGPTAEEVEARRKEMLAREVEKVKAEYEERQRRKKEKEKEKDKEKKDEEKGKGEKGKDKKDDEKEKEKDKEKKSPEPEKEESTTPKPPEPKVFTLNKKIFDLRVNRVRQAQQAKRNAERLRNPSIFPMPPKGDPV